MQDYSIIGRADIGSEFTYCNRFFVALRSCKRSGKKLWNMGHYTTWTPKGSCSVAMQVGYNFISFFRV